MQLSSDSTCLMIVPTLSTYRTLYTCTINFQKLLIRTTFILQFEHFHFTTQRGVKIVMVTCQTVRTLPSGAVASGILLFC